MWVLDHIEDLRADFLAFYRIGPGCPLDLNDLDAPTFFALAHRAAAYGGVMTARMQQQDNQRPRPAADRDVRQVSSTRESLTHELGDLIEVAGG